MTLTLRPHQTKAVKAMLRNTKGQIIVPTGGGKTMCMIEDVKKLFRKNSLPKTVVVVAPRSVNILGDILPILVDFFSDE